MGIFGRKQKKHDGFTVVEVMVVVVVIGILASIVAIGYPQYQRQARDSERKSDLTQLAAALKAYALQKNNYMGTGSGCGLFGDGNGWIALGPLDGGGYYPDKSILTCLKDAGLIKTESDFIDPTGCKSDTGGVCGSWQVDPAKAYMKATCTKDGEPIAYFMAHLEGQPRDDATIDDLCDPGSMPWFSTDSQKWGTNYGMNYYVTVD